MRKSLMVVVAVVMATIGFAAPAQAAVDMPFGMAYGNSTTSGTIHFTDGYSAPVYGTVHAASGTRWVCAYGTNGTYETVTYCSPSAYAGGPDQSLNAPLSLSIPGGVVRVYITMRDENSSALAREVCTRNGCTRVF